MNNNTKSEAKEAKQKVGPEGAVPEGRGATVRLKDGSEVAMFNVNGDLFAIDNTCPHQGFPLADSRLYGDTVECDLHGWRFDVKNGTCLTDSSCSLNSYPVLIEDGWIYIVA